MSCCLRPVGYQLCPVTLSYCRPRRSLHDRTVCQTFNATLRNEDDQNLPCARASSRVSGQRTSENLDNTSVVTAMFDTVELSAANDVKDQDNDAPARIAEVN